MTPSQIAKNLIERIDEKIVALDIRAALEKVLHPDVMRSIDVRVHEGSVILTGTIGSWQRFFEAQRALSSIAQGKHIQNRLAVASFVRTEEETGPVSALARQ